MAIHPSAFIHPRALVEPTATVGAGTKIWADAKVLRGTVLGEDCVISPNVMLDGPVIGDRCVWSVNAAAGPGFHIGNDVFVGPGVLFCNDGWPRADKEGFDGAALHEGRIVTIRVRDRASIGANAILLPGVTLGEGCMIGAGAIVGVDVPAGFLFRRDGSIVPIKPAWTERRMRPVRA
jgi:UDP-2-acetamido-3-amino-2,3-dideoxy-glucuronate N-acetyltransferase